MKDNTDGEITADRARFLTSQRRNGDAEVALRKIFTKIEETATQGGHCINVAVRDLGGGEETVKIVTVKLQEKGFTVDHHSGTDCREGDSWNYLTVSWAPPN